MNLNLIIILNLTLEILFWISLWGLVHNLIDRYNLNKNQEQSNFN